jgi:hypothetical protein
MVIFGTSLILSGDTIANIWYKIVITYNPYKLYNVFLIVMLLYVWYFEILIIVNEYIAVHFCKQSQLLTEVIFSQAQNNILCMNYLYTNMCLHVSMRASVCVIIRSVEIVLWYWISEVCYNHSMGPYTG